MDEHETAPEAGLSYATVTAGEAFDSGLGKPLVQAKELLANQPSTERIGFVAMEAARQVILGTSQWFRFDHEGRLVRVNGDPAIAVPLSEEDRQFVREAFANPVEVKVAVTKVEAKLRALDALLDTSADAQAATRDDEVEASLDDDGDDLDEVESEFNTDELLDDPHVPASRRAALQARLTMTSELRRLKQAEEIAVCMQEQEFADRMTALQEEASAAPKPKWLRAIFKETKPAATDAQAERLDTLEAAAGFYPDAQEKLAAIHALRTALGQGKPSPEEVVAIKQELAGILNGGCIDAKTAAAITVGGVLQVDPQALARAQQALTGTLPPMQADTSSQN